MFSDLELTGGKFTVDSVQWGFTGGRGEHSSQTQHLTEDVESHNNNDKRVGK